ncbi:hypothetical protein F3I16_16110 [Pseudomonas sp. L-22-4S-12]|uniref:hypothetical protein n=1 Tax=Pseudomonas sp. L-22-4S-12 TaxID=2610893 RepID=UPI001320DC40|nr:hypothetical protein [Pseudomonas sp. L-22-4S-12]MWV17567.1 hypothetical protein [Pseudomonas sp. L-22-4S-12]
MKQLFVNNFATALVGGVAAGDGILVVASVAGLPTPTAGEYFLLTLIGLDANGNEVLWEVVKVTTRAGSTLTVSRDQEGTGSRDWPDGTLVEARLTAGSMGGKQDVAVNLTALAELTGAPNRSVYFTAAGAMSVYDLTVFGRQVSGCANDAALRTLLALGSAATRNATTSATDTTSERLWRTNDLVKQTGPKDTTAGSVLLQGAGGWMGTAPVLTSNDFDNDSTYNGLVRSDNSIAALNGPPVLGANMVYTALNARFNASYGWQLGVSTSGASPTDAGVRAFLRNEVNNLWSNYAELWHSLNFNPALKANTLDASFSGTANFGNALQVSTTSGGIEVGRRDGVAGTAYIDMHAGATVTDYDARLQCTTGNGTAGQGTVFLNCGTLDLNPVVGAVQLRYAGTQKLATTAFGVTVSGGITAKQQGETMALQGTVSGVGSTTYISFEQDNGTRDGYMGVASATTTDMYVAADTGDVLIRPILGSSVLHEAGAAKLTTTPTGISVTGQVESSLPTYTNLTLLAPFTWDSAGDSADYHRPSYTKVDNVVRLRGKVTVSGTHANADTFGLRNIAVLPVGYRPTKRKAFTIFWDSDSPLYFGFCWVFVNTDGGIYIIGPNQGQPYPFTEGHFPLDQIWFDLAN